MSAKFQESKPQKLCIFVKTYPIRVLAAAPSNCDKLESRTRLPWWLRRKRSFGVRSCLEASDKECREIKFYLRSSFGACRYEKRWNLKLVLRNFTAFVSLVFWFKIRAQTWFSKVKVEFSEIYEAKLFVTTQKVSRQNYPIIHQLFTFNANQSENWHATGENRRRTDGVYRRIEANWWSHSNTHEQKDKISCIHVPLLTMQCAAIRFWKHFIQFVAMAITFSSKSLQVLELSWNCQWTMLASLPISTWLENYVISSSHAEKMRFVWTLLYLFTEQ